MHRLEKAYLKQAKPALKSTPEVGSGWMNALAVGLAWAGRLLTLLLLVGSPWLYGCATWGAQIWVVALVAIIFVLAVAYATLRNLAFETRLAWLLASLVGMAMLQSLWLPEAVWSAVGASAGFERQVAALAAEYEVKLNEADAPASGLAEGESQAIRAPRTLSIYPVQTRASVAVFAAALALLISACVLFRDENWAVALFATISLTTLLHALLGILQSVSWNDWTLLADMPGNVYFSTFVSRNSAPQYYAIGIGTTLGLMMWRARQRKQASQEKRYHVRYPAVNMLARLRRRLEDLVTELEPFSVVMAFVVTFLAVAVLAAASRGGILACGAAVLVTTLTSLGRDSGVNRSGIFLAIVAAIVLIMLTTLEMDQAILDRLETISQEATSQTNPRYRVWQLAVSNPSYWLAGCGLGTFHFGIIPMQVAQNGWTYHAESVYVEVLSELGVVGLVCMLAGLTWLIKQIAVSDKNTTVDNLSRQAVLFALTAIGLQSTVDFSLILPAIFLPLVCVVGCYIGRSVLEKPTKPTRKSHYRREPSIATSTTRWQSWLLVSIVSVCIIQGIAPLLGFAMGEALEHWHRRNPSGSAEFRPQTILRVTRFLPSAEKDLQTARIRQARVESRVAESHRWPAETTSDVRERLSEAELIAAAVRAGDGLLADLRRVALGVPDAVSELVVSSRESQRAATACVQDWRASWGIARGDCGQLSTADRAANYARLALLTKHDPSLQQRVGTEAILAGEREIGTDFLRRCLAANPSQAVRIVPMVGSLLTAEELDVVLPGSQLVRANVAQSLEKIAKNNSKAEVAETAQAMMRKIDLTTLAEEAQNATDWLTVAWLAENRKDFEATLNALEKAALLSPLYHEIRWRKAQLLDQFGDTAGAIREMEQAIRRAPQNATYKAYLEELQSRKAGE